MIRDQITAMAVQHLFKRMNRTFTTGEASTGMPDFRNRELALYLHFPFCDSICRYCPFSRTAQTNDMATYMDTIIEELRILRESGSFEGTRITSVAFGGGTPSLIPERYLYRIVEELRATFPEYDSVQKTMECTPDSITQHRLMLFEELGFNRLTIGVQSLQEAVLTELGRKETPTSIRNKLTTVRRNWKGSWSCDLIYGFDSHSSEGLLNDIRELHAMGSDHFSLFPLINSNAKNHQSLPAKQLAKMYRMYHDAAELLHELEFPSYSVEDFSRRSEAECHYQKDVWEFPQRDLLILGSGGFGIAGGVQYRKEKNRKKYIESVQNGVFPVDRFLPIDPTREEKIRPLMGLHYNSVKTEALPLSPILKAVGVVQQKDDAFKLTRRGQFLTSLLWAKVMLHRMVN